MRLKLAIFATLMTVGSATAQERPTYEIGILSDELSPDQAPLLDRIIAEITAVVGQNATISFSRTNLLINNFDRGQARANYQTLLDRDVDIVIAFGPVNNEMISGQTTHAKPTILFGTLNQDLIQVNENLTSSGIDNFTYVITPQSYTQDLDTFRELVDFNNVGIVAREAPLAVLPIVDTFDRYFADSDADYEMIPYRSPESLRPFLDRIDALYLAEGFGIPAAEIQQIANMLIERGIPSFTSTRRDDVVVGIMATNQADENLGRFFRRIALHVEAVVDGVNLSERPVFIDLNETLAVNFRTAQLVGVPIRYSMIATTEFVGDVVNPLAEERYSFLDAVNEALDANLQILADRKDVELSEQDVRTAKSTYLPSLSAIGTGTYTDPDLATISNGQNPEYSTSGALSLNQTIFAPDANANISIQNSLLRAQQENLNGFELDLVLDVANAYLGALIAKASLQIRNRNFEVTRRNLQIAERNFEAGQSGRGDVLRLQSQSAQDMQALVEAINQLQSSFYSLNLLVNQQIDRPIDVEDVFLEEGVFRNYGYDQVRTLLDDPSQRRVFEDFLVGEAMQNAPELKALDYSANAAARTVSLNGAERFLPTVGAQFQYSRTFDQWGAGVPSSSALTLNDTYNIGVMVSVPIFDSNQRNINRQAARIQLEQLQLRHDLTSTAIERNVKSAILDVRNQIANIELSETSERAAAQSLALTESAYANGAVTIVDLLDAQTNHLNAQLASANATYNYLTASLVLERQIGYFFLLSSDEENEEFFGRFLVHQANQSRQD